MTVPYERAIAEQIQLGDTRVLKLWPVDGVEIFDQEGRDVWCWNALSSADKRRLVDGNYVAITTADPAAGCDKRARVLIEFPEDEAPGPRFYCLDCGAARLSRRADEERGR